MVRDIDIHRTANLLIKQYGESALVEAMNRVNEFRAQGNEPAASTWNRISDAIEWLQLSPGLSSGTTKH